MLKITKYCLFTNVHDIKYVYFVTTLVSHSATDSYAFSIVILISTYRNI